MRFILSAGLLFILSSTSVFADTDNGKKLHDATCMKCHGNEVYSRDGRFIKDREALNKQVSRCQLNAGAQWFDEDVADVVQYLDETFYKFK
ncbi:hypothetical protein MNBD_GAMMA15-171 [hydrothermal vent metagenome]|uniref:Cytochrome c domain-containing protein n=1 Tax=hydrothermal vent metagenome TaxID=652676 RepID=A0A3B0YB54_9ZZZZ